MRRALRLLPFLFILCWLPARAIAFPSPALASSADGYVQLPKDLKVTANSSSGIFLSYLDGNQTAFPDGGKSADEILELNEPNGSNTSVCRTGLSCLSAAAPVCISCPAVNTPSGASNGTGDDINGGGDVVHGFAPDTGGSTSMTLSISNLPAGPVRLILRSAGGGNFPVTWTDTSSGSTQTVFETTTLGSFAEFTTSVGATSGTFTLSPPVGTTISDVLVERPSVTLTQDLKITGDSTSGVTITNFDGTPAHFPDGADTASDLIAFETSPGTHTLICQTGTTCANPSAACGGGCNNDESPTALIDAGSGDQINGGTEERHGWSAASAANPELIVAAFPMPTGPVHLILRLAGTGTFTVFYTDDGGAETSQSVTMGANGGAFVEFTSTPTATSGRFDFVTPFGVDVSDLFIESDSAPTAAHINSFSITRRTAATLFHWRSAASDTILGFNLLSGSHRLNSRMIAAHAGSQYHYRVATRLQGRVTLQAVLRDGRTEEVGVH